MQEGPVGKAGEGDEPQQHPSPHDAGHGSGEVDRIGYLVVAMLAPLVVSSNLTLIVYSVVAR